MYYGCANSSCGVLKCSPHYADCNNDQGDGCEADVRTDQHCASCANACPAGETCYLNQNVSPNKYECGCAPGLRDCGSLKLNSTARNCVDVLTDVNNCGGCHLKCFATLPHGGGVCSYGSCSYTCEQGWGDCNGNPDDGCETNLMADPNNCGGCGGQCLAGQPCVVGQCAVAECDGGTPR
jgi:hypothetical protein